MLMAAWDWCKVEVELWPVSGAGCYFGVGVAILAGLGFKTCDYCGVVVTGIWTIDYGPVTTEGIWGAAKIGYGYSGINDCAGGVTS